MRLRTCICRLAEQGARLAASDVERVEDVLGSDTQYFDLSVESDDDAEDGDDVVDQREGGAAAAVEQETAGVYEAQKPHGYFVKNFMETRMAPEIKDMEGAYPGIIEHWDKHGMDAALGADGTNSVLWTGLSEKYEVGAAKNVAPAEVGAKGPQQNAFLAMPAFMHKGALPL